MNEEIQETLNLGVLREWLTAKELAEVLGLTVQRVYNLRDMDILKQGTQGYKLENVTHYIQYIRSGNRLMEGVTSPRDRLITAQAEKAETENAIKAGKLVNANDIKQVLVPVILEAVKRLRNLPMTNAGEWFRCKTAIALSQKVLKDVDAELSDIAHIEWELYRNQDQGVDHESIAS
jgi:phage terminase Nu1 subunit (DNA packaging protein)